MVRVRPPESRLSQVGGMELVATPESPPGLRSGSVILRLWPQAGCSMCLGSGETQMQSWVHSRHLLAGRYYYCGSTSETPSI